MSQRKRAERRKTGSQQQPRGEGVPRPGEEEIRQPISEVKAKILNQSPKISGLPDIEDMILEEDESPYNIRTPYTAQRVL